MLEKFCELQGQNSKPKIFASSIIIIIIIFGIIMWQNMWQQATCH